MQLCRLPGDVDRSRQKALQAHERVSNNTRAASKNWDTSIVIPIVVSLMERFNEFEVLPVLLERFQQV